MLKKHKTVEQVSQETGIKKGSLEMYILGKDIMTDDLDILTRYFQTNSPYLTGIWGIAADEKHVTHFRKLFKDSMMVVDIMKQTGWSRDRALAAVEELEEQQLIHFLSQGGMRLQVIGGL